MCFNHRFGSVNVKLFDPFFTLYLLVWSAVKISRHYDFSIGIVNSYLTDFLAVPAMSHLGSYLISMFYFKQNYYTYPISYSLLSAVVLSVLLEGIMPLFSPQYTADFVDVVCYFSGALFYEYIHKFYLKKRYAI